VVLGDLDGDGQLDAAVANSGGNTVSVLLNAGLQGPTSVPPSARAGAGGLAAVYPNPAHGPVNVRYSVPPFGKFTLGIYDPAGRLVRSWLRPAAVPGAQSLRWDLRNDRGATVPSGVYYVRLSAGEKPQTVPVVVLPR